MLEIFEGTIRHVKDPTGDTADLVVSPLSDLKLFDEVTIDILGLNSKWYVSSIKNEVSRLRVGLMSKTAVLGRSMVIKEYSGQTVSEIFSAFADLTGLSFDAGDFGSTEIDDATSWIGTTIQDALKDLADQVGAYLIVGADSVSLSDSPQETIGNTITPKNVLSVTQDANAMGVATKVVATWIDDDDGNTIMIEKDVDGDFGLNLYYYVDTSNMDSEDKAREAVEQKAKAFGDQLNTKSVKMAGIIPAKVGDKLDGYGMIQEIDYQIGERIETKMVVA